MSSIPGNEQKTASIRRALAASISPSHYLKTLGVDPYVWQVEGLSPAIRRLIFLAARQAGKSTVVAGKAMHRTKYNSNFLTLIVCPSKDQSKELIKKIDLLIIEDLELPELVHDSVFEKEFANGSRIVALPGSERSVRSYSGPGLIIIDEASRVLDETYMALRPMMTGADTELILMSTGAGKRGFFFREWSKGIGWVKIEVNVAFGYKDGKLVDAMPEEEYRALRAREGVSAYYSPRHTREFLEQEISTVPEYWFQQEYGCKFVDPESQIFSYELIQDALIRADGAMVKHFLGDVLTKGTRFIGANNEV